MADLDTRTSVDIKLAFPIELDGGGTLDTITMRRPKVRDNIKASKAKGNELEKGIALIADLCDQPVEVFYGLDESDLDKLNEQYSAFTGRRPETQTSDAN